MFAVNSLRVATQEDVDAMAYVHATSWQETYRNLLEDSVISSFNVDHRKKMWAKFLNGSTNSQRAYVAIVADRIVGIASWVEKDEQVELLTLYILKEFQQNGLGTSLFRQVEHDVLVKEKPLITWVLSSNKATAFYEKMGLKPVKTEEKKLSNSIVQEVMFSN